MEKENKGKEREMRRVARAQEMKEKEEKGKTTTSKRRTTNTVSKAGKKYKKGKCGVKVRHQLQFDDQSDSDESDTDCLYCNELYSCSTDREGWMKCSSCSRWDHEACAGCDDEDDRFVCEYCLYEPQEQVIVSNLFFVICLFNNVVSFHAIFILYGQVCSQT
ncbi:hypothetical protein JTB14_026591 [Gonioctena quinquepunctata]|nr:hypothetical protein JTB14_026591 [Gonioctena quinquepunctata]